MTDDPGASPADSRSAGMSAALGAGSLAAVVTALPAVPRATELGVAPVAAALVLIGGSALLLGPALAFALAAPMSRGLRGALIGLSLAAAPLAWFAEVLKLRTNHRPLGAATFTVLAIGIALAFVLVALKLLSATKDSARPVARAAEWSVLTLAAGSLALALYRSLATPELVVHVLDALRALATLVFAGLLLRIASRRSGGRVRFARAGLPLWVALVVAGAVALAGSAGSPVKGAAPVLTGPISWL